MKKAILFFLLITSTLNFGQVPDSLKNKWMPFFVINAGINQIAFTNWVKGGDNSIAWTFLGDFHYDLTGDVWDVRLDNIISAQITKIIAVNFTYLAAYEKAQSPYTQVKEGLQIGITYRLL